MFRQPTADLRPFLTLLYVLSSLDHFHTPVLFSLLGTLLLVVWLGDIRAQLGTLGVSVALGLVKRVAADRFVGALLFLVRHLV